MTVDIVPRNSLKQPSFLVFHVITVSLTDYIQYRMYGFVYRVDFKSVQGILMSLLGIEILAAGNALGMLTLEIG